MRKITKLLLASFLLLLLFNCASDDSDTGDSKNGATPEKLEDLFETEWVYFDDGNPVFIYLGSPSSSAIVVGGNNISQGTHSYQEPNFNLNFDVVCDLENRNHIFSECSISGIIEGDKLTINDNNTEYIFIRLFEDLQED